MSLLISSVYNNPMTLLTEPTRIVLAKGYSLPDDADAVAYIAAVEAADGQALETATRMAINSFVKGCKADGIWNALRIAGITSGARTSAGALIPLIGAAPTLVGMTSANYSRTGFVQTANSQCVRISQNISVHASNTNNHFCAYLNTYQPGGSFSDVVGFASSLYFIDSTRFYNSNNAVQLQNNGQAGFFGTARNGASSFEYLRKPNGYNVVSGATALSAFPSSALQLGISTADPNGRNRYAFYSAGTYLDLRLLDARVTDLINAFAAAIP